eukprot:9422169-Pyramimonas_sp.AAC.3
MRRKSEAMDMLNEFLDEIKQMDKAPKHITMKSDAESVYIEVVFRARCRELGINTVNSPPYVHERNDNAEKLFRDLGDMARFMMAASGFPTTAWPLARLPTCEMVSEPPACGAPRLGDPLLSHVFGCRAFVHTPPGDRDGKLGARSALGLYVGHDNRSAFPNAANREDSVRVVGRPVFIED